MKILIGVDDSSFSRTAVEEVARRSWEPGTAVKILSVIETPYNPTSEEAVLENPYRIARASVDSATETLRRSGNNFEIAGDIIEGSPKRVILDEAETWLADLIVVGSHGRRGLDRFLLGSVSQAVALHAPCSVEIVRAPRRKP
ncbi:MAG TPA: universal stress protein [Blastocatellia bacterium]|jgi:nucleotide-binding universal stress UspA family protein